MPDRRGKCFWWLLGSIWQLIKTIKSNYYVRLTKIWILLDKSLLLKASGGYFQIHPGVMHVKICMANPWMSRTFCAACNGKLHVMCSLGTILCTSEDLKASQWMFYWKLSYSVLGPTVSQIFMSSHQFSSSGLPWKEEKTRMAHFCLSVFSSLHHLCYSNTLILP